MLIVTSKITGLGKTEFIKNKIKIEGLVCKKIPISGSVDPVKIGKRLQQIMQEDNIALYFSLGSVDTKDYSLLNEILFSFVVLRSFHFSKSVIAIPKETPIFFEIDSSYYEKLDEEIEILGYLETKNIKQIQLEEFSYESKKVQFTSQYLKGLASKEVGKKDYDEEQTQKEVLSREECLDLILSKFMKNREKDEKDYLNYTQLNIWIDVLYSLFSSFSKMGYFRYDILSQTANRSEKYYIFTSDDTIIKMRISLIEGLVLAADQFTSKSVETVRKNQQSSMEMAKKTQLEKINEMIGKAVVSWENSKPFTIVFSKDNTPIFVYKHLRDVPEEVQQSIQQQMSIIRQTNPRCENPLKDYQNCTQADFLIKLASLTNTLRLKDICGKCFKKFSKEYQECFFCHYPLEINDSSDEFLIKLSKLFAKDYSLTPDNFIKMLLIFTRVQQRIPVIIMGETGCGKTSLIRYLSTRILDDECKIFPIHAGITQDIILREMKCYIEQAKKLTLDDLNLWVFFDEFNTTSSIGLIKEIMCERTMLGDPLPDNMIFLGACNPWRLKTKNIIFDENVGIKKDRLNKSENYNLLYTVFPLPEAMISYVWDYGHLDNPTEKKYIESMLSNTDVEIAQDLKEKMTNLICLCHQIFRNWEDVSSVSLRDVARYKVLFCWFVKSLNERNAFPQKKDNKETKKRQDSQATAAVLSLLHCYYLRISSKGKRTEFLEKLKPEFDKLGMDKEEVKNLLLAQEMDFLNRMSPLPEGIAQNQALRENVFALIVCILNKIPLFICGKPGCSKSLAVQLVFNNLRGKNSNDEYFRTLPELIPVSYQGSEYCTSESILGIFKRAEKYSRLNRQNQEMSILPVIIFDEIGIAEISANNPLKVLHEKLEVENNEVGFVGISNWRLDASKMNRALYLARPDPDLKDLEFTANAIYESIAPTSNTNEKLIETLARIYSELRDQLKENKSEDIFGLRDYYFLVKGISFDVLQAEKKLGKNLRKDDILFEIARKHLKRSFSGLGNEHQSLWNNFCIYMGRPEMRLKIEEPSIADLILNNLNDENSRYLMLIAQSDCVSEYIEEMIRKKNDVTLQEIGEEEEILGCKTNDEDYHQEIKTLVGSQMSDDVSNPSYGFRILSDIILYIEKGYTLMFKKIDRVYTSLYDLFNQNFARSGDKRYCRIALGAENNPKCLVHKKFRCVIFITEDEVKVADPPFLNRFEKYQLKIEDILPEEERRVKDMLERWIEPILRLKNKTIPPEEIFVNYNSEYLFSLVLKTKKILEAKNEYYDDAEILEVCRKELIATATFDFAVLVSLNINDYRKKEQLLEEYYQTKSLSFRDFSEQILADDNIFHKKIIYTYTQITDEIQFPDRACVTELKLASFKSEGDIIEEVSKYFESNNRLLVIRIDLINESDHLLLIKHLMLNLLDSHRQKKGHHLMIVVHLQRYNIGQVTVGTLFQDWESRTFDNLNENFVHPVEYLEDASFKNLTISDMLTPLNSQGEEESQMEKLFDQCLSRIKYNVDPEFEQQINERRNLILRVIKGTLLLTTIQEKVAEIIEKGHQNENVRFEDWREYILLDEWVRARALSPLDAMNLALSKFYEGYIMKVVYNLEKNCLLDSYFNAWQNEDQELLELWQQKFIELKINPSERLNDLAVEVDFVFKLHFPFSTFEERNIATIQENIDEVERHENPEILNLNIWDEFLSTSFFGEAFYTQILQERDRFNIFFKDQIWLFLQRKNSKLDLDAACFLMKKMFLDNPEDKLRYFITHPKELELIFGVVETVMGMPKGKWIFGEALDGLLNLEEMELKDLDFEHLPDSLLIVKNGTCYKATKEELKSLIQSEDQSLDNMEKEESESAFLYYLFERLVEGMSSCDFVSGFKSIAEVKTSFNIIEEKIWRTGIYPENVEVFQQWIYLLQFIESCDQRPDKQFGPVMNWLKTNLKTVGRFSEAKEINNLIDYLKKTINFREEFSKSEIERKIMRLHTKLFKNLVSSQNFDFYREVLQQIDEHEELWKSSSKIISYFDGDTYFSDTIMEWHGRRDKVNQESVENKLQDLETICSERSEKISLILADYAFVKLKDQWKDVYREVLVEEFENFKENCVYMEKQSKKSKTSKISLEEERPNVALLIVNVWLKTYLYYYSLALEKEEIAPQILHNIDITLSEISPERSTLKLYVLKNLKMRKNKTLKDLRKEYNERNVIWIKPYLKDNPNKNKALDLIVPLPLYQKLQFSEVDMLLSQAYNLDKNAIQKFVALCKEAKKDFNTLICIYTWFLRLYTNFTQEKYEVEPDFIQLLEEQREALLESLGELGCKFIFELIMNFTEESYFRLTAGVTEEEIHQKIIALTVMIVFIAQQFTGSSLGSLFFENNKFRKDLSKYWQDKCLFGQIKTNFLIVNMKNVKENIERRLKQNQIRADAKFIYKCSSKCDYLYFFEDCGHPTRKYNCKVCGNDIGASGYNVLLTRNNGDEQIQMPIPQGMAYIDKYIRDFENQDLKGYLPNSHEENFKVDSKPNILPITFRTLHFLFHTILFGFGEIGFISKEEIGKINNDQDATGYFQKHFLQDYNFLAQLLGNNKSYIWIYEMLFSFETIVRGRYRFDSSANLSIFEKSFEDQIILPLLKSTNTVILNYHQKYTEYTTLIEEEEDVTVFVEELKQNQKKYPWLHYFNFMRFPSFEDFSHKFQLLIGDGRIFPLTTFVLEKHSELANILSLPGIVDFTNYLVKKFNYQISRDEATKKLNDCLKEDDTLRKKFKEFQNSWNRLTFETVRVDCQEKEFQQLTADDSLSIFLPNIIKDESGILMVGTMMSLAALHNEFIYTTKKANNPDKSTEEIIEQEKTNMEFLQSVKTDDAVCINSDQVEKDILQGGYCHHYEYGKGREIIYDFEEMENKLHLYANGKKIINCDKLLFMNYQFELYPESASIFLDIRKKVLQQKLPEEFKIKYTRWLQGFSKKELLAYSGSLDYVFTYLRNIKENGDRTIEDFAKNIIGKDQYQHLNEHVTKRQPLSTVQLRYILDLYELLEEIIFDQAIQDFIRPEFLELIPEQERKDVVNKFVKATLENEAITYPRLKEPQTIAKILKKLILRVLLAQVPLQTGIYYYFSRKDFWDQDTDMNEIERVEFGDEIQLKHAYIILLHLESLKVKIEPAKKIVNDENAIFDKGFEKPKYSISSNGVTERKPLGKWENNRRQKRMDR